MKILFIIHILTSLTMLGLIWFVQIVHYPLFSQIPADNYSLYQQLHMKWTGYLVAPVMLVELITGLLLFFNYPYSDSKVLFTVSMILLAGVWLSTAFIQVPLHNSLIDGSNVLSIKKLVTSNWIRTICWTIRSLILCYILYLIIPSTAFD